MVMIHEARANDPEGEDHLFGRPKKAYGTHGVLAEARAQELIENVSGIIDNYGRIVPQTRFPFLNKFLPPFKGKRVEQFLNAPGDKDTDYPVKVSFNQNYALFKQPTIEVEIEGIIFPLRLFPDAVYKHGTAASLETVMKYKEIADLFRQKAEVVTSQTK